MCSGCGQRHYGLRVSIVRVLGREHRDTEKLGFDSTDRLDPNIGLDPHEDHKEWHMAWVKVGCAKTTRATIIDLIFLFLFCRPLFHLALRQCQWSLMILAAYHRRRCHILRRGRKRGREKEETE